MGRGAEVQALCDSILADRQRRRTDRERLARDTRSMLRGLAAERQRWGEELAAELRRDAQELRQNVRHFLSLTVADRRRCSVETRKLLGQFRSENRRSVQDAVGRWRRQRAEQGRTLAQALRQQAALRRKETAEFLREEASKRAAAFSELNGRLKDACGQVRSFWQGFLAECRQERATALRAWASLREGTETAPPVRAVAAAEERVFSSPLAERVLDIVSAHPEGITLVDMESILGESRVRLGAVTRELLDAGLIAKEGRLYFPAKSAEAAPPAPPGEGTEA